MWILTVKYDGCILMSHFLAHSLASTGSFLLSLTHALFGSFLLPFPCSRYMGGVFLDGRLIAIPLEFGRVAPRLEGRIRKGRLSVPEESSSPGRPGTDSLLASV